MGHKLTGILVFALIFLSRIDEMNFASLIKSERARLGLTQSEAAMLLDVPARTLWEWEHGKTEPLAVAQEGVIARLNRAKMKK